jgi:hypothetical protein
MKCGHRGTLGCAAGVTKVTLRARDDVDERAKIDVSTKCPRGERVREQKPGLAPRADPVASIARGPTAAHRDACAHTRRNAAARGASAPPHAHIGAGSDRSRARAACACVGGGGTATRRRCVGGARASESSESSARARFPEHVRRAYGGRERSASGSGRSSNCRNCGGWNGSGRGARSGTLHMTGAGSGDGAGRGGDPAAAEYSPECASEGEAGTAAAFVRCDAVQRAAAVLQRLVRSGKAAVQSRGDSSPSTDCGDSHGRAGRSPGRSQDQSMSARVECGADDGPAIAP